MLRKMEERVGRGYRYRNDGPGLEIRKQYQY